MRYFLLTFFYLICVQTIWAQDIYKIIDNVNAKIEEPTQSFSYNIKVENDDNSNITLLDSGRLIVNNTLEKYDDFLYIGGHIKDTFCYVKDTLLRVRSEEIFKDYNSDVLHVRLGTTKMFFRCFSSAFRNEVKLINPKR